MKQVQAETYNIAWFSLAECISRGEKERALGVYRLLSHSIDDEALRIQLKADILWAFNDGGAPEKYLDAAHCYKKSGRLQVAALILEHVIALKQQSVSFQAGQGVKILELLDSIADEISSDQIGALYQQAIFLLLEDNTSHYATCALYVKRVIDIALYNNNHSELKQFIAKLHVIHNELYQYACRYLAADTKKSNQ